MGSVSLKMISFPAWNVMEGNAHTFAPNVAPMVKKDSVIVLPFLACNTARRPF